MALIKYTEDHEFISVDGDIGTVGITDYAQEKLGDVTFVELPAVGEKIKQGSPIAVVESVKAASDVYAPLAGEIVASNDTLAGSPEAVNEDAYAAWLFRLRPADPDALAAFMDADAYTRLIAEA